jgi:hypothetical protein
MWYIQIKCIFKITDLKYIDNLTKLYPNIVIQEFKYQNVVLGSIINRPLGDLKTILAELKSSMLLQEDVTVTVSTLTVGANKTTHPVLPKFQPSSAYVNNSTNDRIRFQSDIELLQQFVLDAPDMIARHPCILSQVTNRENAWKLLNLLHEKLPFFLSAIDLPANKGILLLTPNYSFFINYDKGTVDEEIYPAFHLNIGFMSYGGADSPITNEMNRTFIKWKNRGREGLLFSEAFTTNPLLLTDFESTESAAAHTSCGFFSKPLRSHAKENPENSCFSDCFLQ